MFSHTFPYKSLHLDQDFAVCPLRRKIESIEDFFKGIPCRYHAPQVKLARGKEPDDVRKYPVPGMSPCTDDLVRAEEFPRILKGEVILPQVHSVGVCREGDVGVVVDDKHRAGLFQASGKPERRFVDIFPRAALVPVLEEPHSRREREGRGLPDIDPQVVLIEDQTESPDATCSGYSTAP